MMNIGELDIDCYRRGKKMNDLISRQAAIEAIYALHEDGEDGISSYLGITDVGSYPYLKDDYTEGLADCVSEIEDLSSVQQWIPCSERLPEKTGYVLCTAEKKKAINIYNMDGKEKERYVCRGYYLEDEKYFCLHGRPAVNKVIAWQPLPEPYVEV